MSLIEQLLQNDDQVVLGLFTILAACVIVPIKLIPKIPILKKLSFIPFLFFLPMLLSNVGLMPIQHSLYKPLQSVTLYLAIFLMVLAIDVRTILTVARPKVLILFFLGCLGTTIGAVVGWLALTPVIGHDPAAQVAAATSGAYSGGSMNWVAVCEALHVPPSLSATALPACTIVYSLYLGALLLLEGASFRPRLDRWLRAEPVVTTDDDAFVQKEAAPLTIFDYILGLFAFCGVYLISILLEKTISTYFFVPKVIFLTTIALALGCWGPFKKLRGLATLGEAALYFLLCIIGVQGNIVATLQDAPILILMPLIVVIVHAIVMLFSARALRINLPTMCVSSIAAVGGAASAPMMAGVYKMEALIPVGILLGSVGYAVGNYLGIYLGHILLGL